MKVEINRKEDTASITGISITELAIISATLEHWADFSRSAAELSAKFKEIQEELKQKDGII